MREEGKGKGVGRKKTTEEEVKEILEGNPASLKEVVRSLSCEMLQASPGMK